MDDTEKVCCWCRKVIEPGYELEHIHVILLKKFKNEHKDKIKVDICTK